ncbi:low temperature requirement protein A [Streptomyces sp. NPDC047022]|uniref:low temperature requirement protein A n=1 Tax=Streptomyces sp. NPDC047022 TaxID=3155737 RepID=UPI0033F5B575
MQNAAPAAVPADAPGPEARHAGWPELFFDLVFVAVVSQLAKGLHGDPGRGDFLTFLALFAPAWWAWINFMFQANLFDDDRPRARLLLLTAMLSLAAMSAAVPEGLGGRAPVFSLALAATRLVMFAQWWPATSRELPAGQRVPRWRPFTYCVVTATLWAVSAAVPSPWRFVLWVIALAIEVAMIAAGHGNSLPGPISVEHLVERVGLFVIIVLGESVIALITAMSGTWTGQAALVAVLGFVLLAALWWSYFDFATPAAERHLRLLPPREMYAMARDVVAFLHFFAVAGITALAAGLGTVVADAGHHRLPTGALVALAGGQALYHAAHSAISLRYGRTLRRTAPWAVPGVLVPLAVIALGDVLSPPVAVAVLAAEALAHLLAARRGTTRPSNA